MLRAIRRSVRTLRAIPNYDVENEKWTRPDKWSRPHKGKVRPEQATTVDINNPINTKS